MPRKQGDRVFGRLGFQEFDRLQTEKAFFDLGKTVCRRDHSVMRRTTWSGSTRSSAAPGRLELARVVRFALVSLQGAIIWWTTAPRLTGATISSAISCRYSMRA